MPKVSPIYNSFNSGELSDLLRGRSDLEQYNKGGLEFLNMLSLQYGPMCNRPGSMYVADTKVHSTKSRLLRMVRSISDSFIIEMGVSYFRYYTSAGQISGPEEDAHTYTEDELFEVHYDQSNDVLTLVHGDHIPATLTRDTATTFTLADYDFVGTPYLDTNVTSTTITPSATTGTGITLTASSSIFTSDHVGSFWRIGDTHGSPAIQGYVKITAFSSGTSVTADVVVTLDAASATANWAEGAWSDERGWPKRVAYHNNALWMANTDAQPNSYWRSAPFIFDDFNPGTGLEDEAISEKISGAASIEWISGGANLVMGTEKGDHLIDLADDGSVIAANQQTGWGTESVQPRFIGNYIYAAQIHGEKLREIAFFEGENGYKSYDTNAVSEHITKSGIKDMDYQRSPFSQMWCVLNNGNMGVMTREIDQEVLAWTPIETDGEYESVAVIPHPTEAYDMVWTIVKRTIDGSTERHVEYFENPRIPDVQWNSFYVDDGLRFSAFEQTTGLTLTLSAVTGDGVTATSSGAHFVSGDVGQKIRAIDADGNIVGQADIVGFTSSTVVTVDIVKDFPSTTVAAELWGKSVNTISGLDHLEAKTVSLLVDGGENPSKTVSSGSITLDSGNDGFVIAVGLPYTSRWKNMPIDAGSAVGTALGRKKKVYQCSFGMYRSIGMQAGGDVDNLRNIRAGRDPDTLLGLPEDYFTGIEPAVVLNTTHEYDGHIVIQQTLPMPMCITAVMPLVDTEDL